MRILVTGATGFIGSALSRSLAAEGHAVVPLTRNKSGSQSPFWNPAAGSIERTKLENFDALVHLAGENIAGRWSAAKKRRIRESRLDGTRLITRTILELNHPPKIFLCASAIGFYGTRGDAVLTESSSKGSGFLAEVCREWEAECEPVQMKGVRLINARFGMVLDPSGGALASMLPAFKFGLGAVPGSGLQFWSWISRSDLCRAVIFCLAHEELRGPVNFTAPESLTSRQFAAGLAHALHRPCILRIPSGALKLVLGEMAEEVMLSSARVMPKKLLDAGFTFENGEFESALPKILSAKE